MPRYSLGCSGWAYDDWVGPFYPPGTPPGEYLERYARVFGTVEVDSSFYRAPGTSLVRRWADRTPEGFQFALKVPREVTHESDRAKGREILDGFVASLRPLADRGKLAAIVLQFPGSFRAGSGAEELTELLGAVPAAVPLAVELRHSSWWTATTRQALEARKAALVWSVVPHTHPPAWVTGDFLYARFVGDRALTTFDRIQRDGGAAFAEMKQRFDTEGLSVGAIFAYANNHFLGYGPGTVEEFSRVLGLPVPDLSRAARESGQRRLDDAVGPPAGGSAGGPPSNAT